MGYCYHVVRGNCAEGCCYFSTMKFIEPQMAKHQQLLNLNTAFILMQIYRISHD